MLNPEGRWDRRLVLGSGVAVPVRLDLPDAARFPGRRPVALLLGASRMEDLDGNGPGVGPRDSLHLLSRALVGEGIATWRFVWPQSGDRGRIARAAYEACLREPRIDVDHVAIVGFGDSADLVARGYYDLYSVRFPRAVVLFSPSVGAFHLNNLTCPYLILQGGRPSQGLQEAVHHHQSRYGDLTELVALEDLGPELGELYLDDRVVDGAARWLGPAIRQGLRPQEKAARPAA